MTATLTPNRQYHDLDLAYDHFNKELFDGELPKAIITLKVNPRSRGWFHAEHVAHRRRKQTTDEICLCWNNWHSQKDVDILSTLVHEMVHLWQQHFGTPPRKAYHDREWAGKMVEVGLMPSATGQPGGNRTGQRMTHYIIRDGLYASSYRRLVDETAFKLEWAELDAQKGNGKAAKQTRAKFVCPECSQAAWAKLTAHLVCGDCEVDLEKVD